MQCYASANITELREESWGLVVTATNGPTRLEFAATGPDAKRELRIGMRVRATFEMADN